jgi:hypothetical protein
MHDARSLRIRSDEFIRRNAMKELNGKRVYKLGHWFTQAEWRQVCPEIARTTKLARDLKEARAYLKREQAGCNEAMEEIRSAWRCEDAEVAAAKLAEFEDHTHSIRQILDGIAERSVRLNRDLLNFRHDVDSIVSVDGQLYRTGEESCVHLGADLPDDEPEAPDDEVGQWSHEYAEMTRPS